MPEGRLDLLLDDFLVVVLDLVELLVWPGVLACGLVDCFSPWPLPVGPGVVEDLLVDVVEEDDEGEVEVEPGVVLVLDALLDELLAGAVALDELVVVVDELEELELLLEGAQDADWSVLPVGIGICDGEVPGGTSTVSVSVVPPSNVTVTVHVSADAEAEPKTSTVTSAPTRARAATSLWRLTAARLL